MSDKELELLDNLWANLIISRALIEVIFFSICIWIFLHFLAQIMFLMVEGSMTLGPGGPIYDFVNDNYHHGAFMFLLFLSAGALFPLICFISYKLKQSILMVLGCGMIIGALIFTWGSMGFHVNYLNSSPFLIFYGAAFGFMASLASNIFFLNAFYRLELDVQGYCSTPE